MGFNSGFKGLIVNVFTNRRTDRNNYFLLLIRDSEGLNYKMRAIFSDQRVQAIVNKDPQNREAKNGDELREKDREILKE